MNIHTQCLSFLIFVFTLNPTILAQSTIYTKNNRDVIMLLKVMICIYVFSIFCVGILNPQAIKPSIPCDIYWYFVAILFIPITILGEIGVGYICVILKGGQVKNIKLVCEWQKCDKKIILMTALVGLFEEIIYRQIWFYILLYRFHTNILVVIILTALVYALNHIMMGKEIVFQKILAGIIYGTLFYFSGCSIIIPLITHSIQNIFVLLKGGE